MYGHGEIGHCVPILRFLVENHQSRDLKTEGRKRLMSFKWSLVKLAISPSESFRCKDTHEPRPNRKVKQEEKNTVAGKQIIVSREARDGGKRQGARRGFFTRYLRVLGAS